jgi:hypothetical protein
MFSNVYNGISEYLRTLKLLVTKVSAEVGFCRLFSHCSSYSAKEVDIFSKALQGFKLSAPKMDKFYWNIGIDCI